MIVQHKEKRMMKRQRIRRSVDWWGVKRKLASWPGGRLLEDGEMIFFSYRIPTSPPRIVPMLYAMNVRNCLM